MEDIQNEEKLIQFEDIWGRVKTTDTIPAYTPKNVSQQLIIYVSGATIRLYIYDVTNNTWRYTALT